MSGNDLLSDDEALRRAIRWLIEQGTINRSRLEEAGRRFDLSPREQAFLEATLAPDRKE